MNVVHALYDKTKALFDLVNQGLPPGEEIRDKYIEKVNQLLGEREALINELSGSYTDEDLKVGRDLVALNQKLEPLLKDQLKLIETDLRNFKRKKAGMNKYNKGYYGISRDGMFLDKKK